MTTATRPPFVLSSHAHQRALQMGLDRSAVVAAVEDAHTDYPGRPTVLGETRRVATRHDLAVVYAPANGSIITVLWHGKDHR